MTTLHKITEYSGKSTLVLVDQDGNEITYCRRGCEGDTYRPWFKWAGLEPRCLSQLDAEYKQPLLDTLHKCPESLSITL